MFPKLFDPVEITFLLILSVFSSGINGQNKENILQNLIHTLPIKPINKKKIVLGKNRRNLWYV